MFPGGPERGQHLEIKEPEPRRRVGELVVIAGCMFSGKSEELIRLVKRTAIARRKFQLFKPALDKRYGVDTVNSHDGKSWSAIAVDEKRPEEILEYLEEGTTMVAIDEGQFFSPAIVDVCRELVEERGIDVIVAGLDLNFRSEPFGSMPILMAEAEEVTKLTAICVVCGKPATKTQRIKVLEGGERIPANYDDPLILIGAQDDYEARCRGCHEVPGKPEPFKKERK